MRRVTLVTGISPGGWEEYASRTLPAMERNWPADEFVLYVEQGMFGPYSMTELREGWTVRIAEDIPGWLYFQAICRADPRFGGRRQSPGQKWEPKELDAGYSYRYDAAKFSKIAIYVADAATWAEDGALVWVDADVMTHQAIPRSVVLDCLYDGVDVAYLGRGVVHSEIDLVAFRIPEGRAIARTWGDWYTSRRVFSLPEWHSAYTFDEAVRKHAKRPRDLTRSLGDFVDHFKGKGQERTEIAS